MSEAALPQAPSRPEGRWVLWEEARKVPAFVRRDFLVAWSYRMAFFTDWANLGIQVALFYFVGKIVDPESLPSFGGSRVSYIEFVSVGIALAAFMQIALNRLISAMRNEQLMGTLEALLMTPISLATLQLGSVMYDLLYVPVRTFIFLALIALLLDANFAIGGVGAAVVVLLAFIPAVWGLGMISSAAVLAFRRGVGVTGFVILLLTITSSTYFPLEVLPGWIQSLAAVNPITIALQATREALLGHAGVLDVLPKALLLLPIAAVTLSIGILSFRMALKRERRKGTLGLY